MFAGILSKLLGMITYSRAAESFLFASESDCRIPLHRPHNQNQVWCDRRWPSRTFAYYKWHRQSSCQLWSKSCRIWIRQMMASLHYKWEFSKSSGLRSVWRLSGWVVRGTVPPNDDPTCQYPFMSRNERRWDATEAVPSTAVTSGLSLRIGGWCTKTWLLTHLR